MDGLRMESEIQEKVVHINRVAKVVKGGRRFSLTALVVVGDENGRAGYGMGKAKEVPAAISKAVAKAKKNMINVPMKGSTVTHQILGQFGAGRVLLKPAAPGTGIIAGGPVRSIMDVAGIKDILAKSLGSTNPLNIVKATFQGLESLKEVNKVAALRGIKVEDVLPKKLAEVSTEKKQEVKAEKQEVKPKERPKAKEKTVKKTASKATDKKKETKTESKK